MNSAEKKEILLLIKDKWSDINADFSDKGTNRHTRENAWKEILEECKSKGHGWTKQYDHRYLSATKWPSWRAEFNRKTARNKKTGSGGVTCLNEFDKMIMEIIGTDSPDIATLGVPETFSGQAAEADFLAKQKLDTPGISSQSYILDESQTPRSRKRRLSEISSKTSIEEKRSQLLDLELQLKKRQIYEADLRIYNMECEMQIPHRFLQLSPIDTVLTAENDTVVTVENDDMISELSN
ncbi:hypothetical protein DdX_11022 [Ditylenchus destructor]|uniref:Regulatory protein zeste n=1 Tax=Ditylenchus destructor TaxID=166010 RepID=A0AAD4N3G7_9BILA|nr:hypothetical protein DdX_11022 [Ditylenchus destructor]